MTTNRMNSPPGKPQYSPQRPRVVGSERPPLPPPPPPPKRADVVVEVRQSRNLPETNLRIPMPFGVKPPGSYYDELTTLRADNKRLREERNELREAHEFIADEMGNCYNFDGGDWQEGMEKRGLLVKVPADEEFKEEFGEDWMYVLRWETDHALVKGEDDE